MASEFREKGAHVLLGPVAGPLGRSAHGGRNWEGLSPDPYLTAGLFVETIRGIQDKGVQACAKHFIGNEQETQRQPSEDDKGTTIESVSSNIDDRTMHELYLWPFQEAVRAGVASVRSRYQSGGMEVNSIDAGNVQLQQNQPDIRLPEQQDPEWNPQRRAGLSGVCHVRLGCDTQRRCGRRVR